MVASLARKEIIDILHEQVQFEYLAISLFSTYSSYSSKPASMCDILQTDMWW